MLTVAVVGTRERRGNLVVRTSSEVVRPDDPTNPVESRARNAVVRVDVGLLRVPREDSSVSFRLELDDHPQATVLPENLPRRADPEPAPNPARSSCTPLSTCRF